MEKYRGILSRVGTILLVLFALSCEDDPVSPPLDDGGTPRIPDRTPPETVGDLSLSFDPLSNNVLASWTAPRDDERHDRVARYEIRYAYAFPMDWWTAPHIVDPPRPLVAGSAQSYTIVAPPRGRDLYVAIRSLDAAGYWSPVSSIAHARVPGYSFEATCLDAMTGTPVAGLDVQIAERYSHRLVTDAGGRVALDDIVAGSFGIRVGNGAAATLYHGLEETFILDGDRALDYPMVEFVPADNVPYESVLAVLAEAVLVSYPILKKWRSHPVPFYAPALVNVNGLDYFEIAQRAAARWNEATGLPLFVAVDSPPTIGVTIQFLPASLMGGQIGVTSYTSDAEGYPLFDRIRVIDAFTDEQKLYSVMLHELGHTIRLAHLVGPAFIMSPGHPLPTDISRDEVRAVQLMTALPNGMDLGIYDEFPAR